MQLPSKLVGELGVNKTGERWVKNSETGKWNRSDEDSNLIISNDIW